MNKIAEYERILELTKTEPLHYENTPGLVSTPEKAREFRISCIKELIEWTKQEEQRKQQI